MSRNGTLPGRSSGAEGRGTNPKRNSERGQYKKQLEGRQRRRRSKMTETGKGGTCCRLGVIISVYLRPSHARKRPAAKWSSSPSLCTSSPHFPGLPSPQHEPHNTNTVNAPYTTRLYDTLQHRAAIIRGLVHQPEGWPTTLLWVV